jgi:hypothetical protein
MVQHDQSSSGNTVAHVFKFRNKALFKGLACKATAATSKAMGNQSALDSFMAGLSNHGTHGR